MTELATLGLSIRSDGVVVATDRLKDFEGAGRRAEGVAGSLARAAAGMAVALAGAFSVRAISQYADAWSDMQSRVGAAVKDMEAAPALMQRMVDLANASYSPLEQTVEVYTRNVGVLRDLGVSAAGAADFTESLNHMLVITATRGERAASVQNALSKAMATGRLQADGLETVLANGGRVAEALANELGTTVSGLRAMSSQGKITGDVIKNALLNSLEDVRAEAAEMPATIADAFTRIQTNTMALVGTLDQAWGISGRVAEQMLAMADGIRGAADTMLRLGNIVGAVVGPAFDVLAANMGTITSLATVAVAAMAGFYAPALINGLWATSTALVTGVAGGIRAVTAAMLANPLGLLVAGLAAAVTAAFMFRDQIRQAFGVDVVGVVKGAANTVVGAFVGAYQAIVSTWSMLPSAIGDVVITTVNGLIGAVEAMMNNIIGKLNNFMNDVRLKAYEMGFPLKEGVGTPISPLEIGRVDNPNAGAAASAVSTAGSAFRSAMGRDYIGGVASSLSEVWKNAAGAGDAIGALAGQIDGGSVAGGGAGAGGGLAGAAKAANDNMKTLANDGLKAAADRADEFANNLGKSIGGALKGLISGTKDFGQVMIDVLGNVAQFALQQASSIFGGMGGGFGFFGSILSGLFGGGFANGGYTGNMGRSSVAGVVHGGEYVFSAPAVDKIGLGNLDSMHRSARGYQSGGYVTPAAYSSANSNQLTIRTVSEVRNGNLVPVMTEVAGEVAGQRVAQAAPAIVGASEVRANKSAPAAVAKYQQQRGGGDYRVA